VVINDGEQVPHLWSSGGWFNNYMPPQALVNDLEQQYSYVRVTVTINLAVYSTHPIHVGKDINF